MNYQLIRVAVLLAPSLAHAAGPQTWRPLPASLWAVQVFVPPGTNDTRTVQVVPSAVPIAVPGAVSGAAVGDPPAPGSSPVSSPGPSSGQTPPLPPGIPAGVGPGATGTTVSPSVTTPSASAAIVPRDIPCKVSLSLGRTDIAHAGGEFSVPATLEPAACPASIAIAVPWIKLLDAKIPRLVAEPNLTPATREAIVLIGERSFFIRQAAPPQPGLAAAPGRLVFGVNRKGESSTKLLTIWSDGSRANFKARAAHSWLLVTPRKSRDTRQSYDVSIRPDAALPPGTHDTSIELIVAGAQNRSMRIPVVVEVEGRI